VEAALYEDRALLRVLAMRRTMFVAPVDTAAILLAACSRDVAARERKRLLAILAAAEIAGAGHDLDAWLRGAEEAVLTALATRGEATAAQIAADDARLSTQLVLAPGTTYEAKVSVASRVLTVLGAEGRVIRTRPNGTWTSTQYRWAALSSWHPGVAEHATEPARAELARRWLSAFGPATPEDLKWWTGWTVGQTRAALAAVATTEVRLDGGTTALVVAGDEARLERPAPWAALLPALDATTMGWKERGWYLGDHGPRVFDANGNAGPTVWWDGRVVGGWTQAPGGEIRTKLLEDPGAEARAAIDGAAATIAAFIGDARISPRARARSPVERELLA
jgi:hypothetical protein